MFDEHGGSLHGIGHTLAKVIRKGSARLLVRAKLERYRMLVHVRHAKLPRTCYAVPAHGEGAFGAHRTRPQAADNGKEHGRPTRPPTLVTLPQVLAPVKHQVHKLRAQRFNGCDKSPPRPVGGSANRNESGFIGHIARSTSVEDRDLGYSARFYTVLAGHPRPISLPRSRYTAV